MTILKGFMRYRRFSYVCTVHVEEAFRALREDAFSALVSFGSQLPFLGGTQFSYKIFI